MCKYKKWRRCKCRYYKLNTYNNSIEELEDELENENANVKTFAEVNDGVIFSDYNSTINFKKIEIKPMS